MAGLYRVPHAKFICQELALSIPHDFWSFLYISKQVTFSSNLPLLFLSWGCESKASHQHYMIIFSLFLLPLDIVSNNPWEEITGEKTISLPNIPDRLWWIITTMDAIMICVSELLLLTYWKQKGWYLWVEKLKKGHYSICGSAGVPCAVVIGLDIKALGARTEDAAAFYFLTHCINTFSWLALQGSFVPQKSQKACTSCLSTFGFSGVMGRQHVLV